MLFSKENQAHFRQEFIHLARGLVYRNDLLKSAAHGYAEALKLVIECEQPEQMFGLRAHALQSRNHLIVVAGRLKAVSALGLSDSVLLLLQYGQAADTTVDTFFNGAAGAAAEPAVEPFLTDKGKEPEPKSETVTKTSTATSGSGTDATDAHAYLKWQYQFKQAALDASRSAGASEPVIAQLKAEIEFLEAELNPTSKAGVDQLVAEQSSVVQPSPEAAQGAEPFSSGSDLELPGSSSGTATPTDAALNANNFAMLREVRKQQQEMAAQQAEMAELRAVNQELAGQVAAWEKVRPDLVSIVEACVAQTQNSQVAAAVNWGFAATEARAQQQQQQPTPAAAGNR